MSKKTISAHTLGPKALEMVMRDVLGGIEELAIMKSYKTSGDVFEVISIDPSETEKESSAETNDTQTDASKTNASKENRTTNSADIIPITQFRNQTKEKK